MSEPAPSQQAPPILGEPGEPCGRCGAPLAADQRYCLNCGRAPRRARGSTSGSHLKSERTAAPSRPRPPGPRAALRRTAERRREAASATTRRWPRSAGSPCSGLMLLIGVLIGSGTGATERRRRPRWSPSAERAGGTAAGGGAAKAVPGRRQSGRLEGGEGEDRERRGHRRQRRNRRGAGGQRRCAPRPRRTERRNTRNASAKLPDEIATPGAPPPEDNKAPGGGSEGTTIE